MALGVPFFPSSSTTPLFLPLPSDGVHVVGGQHALLAGALHAAVHPALVDLVHVHDHVPVHEGHLVVVGSGVVVDGPVPLLGTRASVRRLSRCLLGSAVKKETYPTAGRRGSSSLAHWFRSRITVVVLGTGRRLVTSWRKSD